jgi:hypothetical protein
MKGRDYQSLQFDVLNGRFAQLEAQIKYTPPMNIGAYNFMLILKIISGI